MVSEVNAKVKNCENIKIINNKYREVGKREVGEKKYINVLIFYILKFKYVVKKLCNIFYDLYSQQLRVYQNIIFCGYEQQQHLFEVQQLFSFNLTSFSFHKIKFNIFV